MSIVSIPLASLARLLNGDRGSNYPSGDEQLSVGHCLFLSTGNVREGYFRFDSCAFVTEKKHLALGGGTIQLGDIVLTIRGTLGNAAVVDDRFPFAVARINSAMAILRPRDGVSPEYLKYFILSPIFRDWVGLQARGSAQPHLRAQDINSAEIPLLSEVAQRRIVAKLDSLRARSSRARHELDRIPKLIERYKQAILAKAFSGELLSTCTYGTAVKLSHYVRQLDQGWSPKCEAFASTSPDRWAVLKTTAVQPIHFQENENKQLPSGLAPRSAIEVNAGDVLITRAGPRSRVGITCVVKTTRRRLMLADKIYRLKCHQELADPVFVALLLNAPQALVQIEQMKTGISDSGLNLTQDKFLNLPIPDVPLQAQLEIVRRVELAFTWLDKIATEHARAEHLLPKLDQAILAKAFRGELVPQDPNDEPASVLLERIKAEREGSEQTRRRRARA